MSLSFMMYESALISFPAKVTKQFSNAGYVGRTGSFQQYMIPANGRYRIKAGGARGGRHVTNYGSYPGIDVIHTLHIRVLRKQ